MTQTVNEQIGTKGYEEMYMPYLVFCLSAIYYLSYYNYGFIINDWGMILVVAERFLQGDIFYRDFSILYTPGIYIYTAIAFKLFGTSLSSAMLGWSILRVFSGLFIYLIGKEISSARTAIVLPLLLWLVPGSLHKSFFVFFVLLAILILIKLIDARSGWLYFFAGAFAGITALFRIDLCGIFFVVFMSLEILKVIEARFAKSDAASIKTVLIRTFNFSLGIVLSVLPVFVYLYHNSALTDAYQQTVDYSAAMKSVWFYVPELKQLFELNTIAVYKYTGLIFPFVLYFIVLILVVMMILGRGYKSKDKLLFVVLLFGSMTLNQAMVHPGVSRISLILPPVLISIFYIINDIKSDLGVAALKRIDSLRKILLAGLTLLILVYISITCFISDPYINNSISTRFINKALLDESRLNVYTEQKYLDEFRAVTKVIKDTTDENEYIFTFPNNSQMFHFVTGRRVLEKFSTISEYLKSEEKQNKVINLLKNKEVEVIISTLKSIERRKLWAPVLDDYIMNNYQIQQTVGNYSFLVKK